VLIDSGERDPELDITPILDEVDESEIDKTSLNSLTDLGFDKDISMLAIKRVGNEYGVLGFGGL